MHKSRANTTFLFSSLSPKTNPLSPSTFPSVSPSTWWFHTVFLTPKYCTASMISSVCQLYSRQADITGWRGRSGANSEHTSHENTRRHKHANTHTCMDEYKGKYEETWIICHILYIYILFRLCWWWILGLKKQMERILSPNASGVTLIFIQTKSGVGAKTPVVPFILKEYANFFSFCYLPSSIVPDKKIDTILLTVCAVTRKRQGLPIAT